MEARILSDLQHRASASVIALSIDVPASTAVAEPDQVSVPQFYIFLEDRYGTRNRNSKCRMVTEVTGPLARPLLGILRN